MKPVSLIIRDKPKTQQMGATKYLQPVQSDYMSVKKKKKLNHKLNKWSTHAKVYRLVEKDLTQVLSVHMYICQNYLTHTPHNKYKKVIPA